jgi:serine/threonine protein kinase
VKRLDNVVRAEVSSSPPPRLAGAEPIAGYRLLEPLGRGGFGEVWKCEVPGGLQKAIKFVPTSTGSLEPKDSPADQELDALRRIKAIRHPFLLSIERVEVAAGELLIVMELADRSLQDVLANCRRQGLAGIPRENLLSFLLEAAEALDVLNFQHGLQHLDIKPANLFLVSDHVKVADFGLVNSPEEFLHGASPRRKGITPLYAAPEVLQGGMSRHCDQYSLALVYRELLTGTQPLEGQNIRQLMMERLTGEPNLEALPPADRPVLARALTRDPDQRFPSCLDFVQALLVRAEDSSSPRAPVELEPPARLPQGNTKAFSAAQKSTALLRRPPALRTPAPSPDSARRVGRPEAATTPHAPPSGAAAVAEDQASSSGPSLCLEIPGYHFLECLSRSPLGEVWKVRGPDNRERLAQILPALAGGSAEAERLLFDRLGALRHPGLAPADLLRLSCGRVAVLTVTRELTLRDRFQECREDGLPGIPRPELLAYLAQAAEALDALYRQHGLPHLGLCPGNLLVEGDQVALADFGLIALAWLPTGEPAGALNPRYAAPELLRKGGTPAADQYSLALIYAEMLSGVHARGKKAASRPTLVRPVDTFDLDHLPAPDRDILARALHRDPRQRFATCTEMIQALEGVAAAEKPLASLPAVLPCSSLGGEAVPPGLVLPSVTQLVMEALRATVGPLELGQIGNSHYVLRPGPVLEHRCPIRFFPGAMRLKLSGFRQQWKGAIVSRDEHSYICRVQAARTFWQRWVGGEAGLEVQVRVESGESVGTRLSEAVVRIQPFGSLQTGDAEKLIGAAPSLLDSLRSYLQASGDQRACERWPYAHPVHVYPVLSDAELGDEVEGAGKDLSLNGVCYIVPGTPASDRIYLRLSSVPGPAEFALLARVVRVLPRPDGCCEVGAAFFGDEASGTP